MLFPTNESYCLRSPSGGLMDAVAWGKPVLATALPVVLDLFRQGGDIGHVCGDIAQFEATLDEVVTRPDAAHHARQSFAIRRLAEQRSPSALAARYRQQTLASFPGLSAARLRGAAAVPASAKPAT